MSLDADWSLDFCLSCDKQTTDGPYCSQSCRLADFHNNRLLELDASPSSSAGSSPGGFYLPPAIDFSAYKKSTTSPSTSASPPRAPIATRRPPSSPPLSTTKPLSTIQSFGQTRQRNGTSIESIDTSSQGNTSSTTSSCRQPSTPIFASSDFQLFEETRQALRHYESLFRSRRSPSFPYR